MVERERCTFKADVQVTSANMDDILTVCPHLQGKIRLDDITKIDYSVNIMYLGEVARKLKAMKRLGARGTNQESTDVLIKQVFVLFKD
jgi:hypothetical protein